MRPSLALLPALLLASAARADEGMWLPEQLPSRAARLKELGLELPVEALADPKQAPLAAIVSLGFCSASFVSPDGLILTNHHCVGGYLGYNSSAEANRARDGHLAVDRAGELSAGPAARLQIVESIEDVTARVLGAVGKRTDDAKREAAVARAQKELVAVCEKQPGRRCRVAEFDSGRSYRLIRSVELKDVRIVYAPPESVGAYGGEVDNWMWPRHAGDFAVLRAYVGPDGQPAAWAPDNVPYQPAHHLRIDPTGAQEGEMVMVAGFPGGTSRNAPSWELAFQAARLDEEIARYTRYLEILEAESARDPEAAARLASSIDVLGNGRKYMEGLRDNFRASGVVERLQARDEALAAWVAADKKRQQRYAPVLTELRARQAEAEARQPVESVHGRLVRFLDLLQVASTALRLADERKKPDLERDPGYQDRDRERIAQRFQAMERTIWLPADRALLEQFLAEHAALPPEQHIGPLDAWLRAQGGPAAAVERLFRDPALARTEARLALLESDSAALRRSEDPWVQLAVALESWRAPRRIEDKARDGAALRLRPLYVQALQEAFPGELYPDANGTLRISYGRVEGYQPRDGLLALPRTTVSGMAAKAGPAPFDAPERLLRAALRSRQSAWADPALGDVPCDFLSTLDTTGGNSGSATLNGRGELVGLLFDGNYEAMSADYLYDPALTRSIHVDVRYLLWMLDEVEGAQGLLAELRGG